MSAYQKKVIKLAGATKDNLLMQANKVNLLQYPRGVNRGGVLNTDISPTVSTSSFESNMLIVLRYSRDKPHYYNKGKTAQEIFKK